MTPQSPAGVESSTIAIFCKVQGSPTPTVTWYKNGTLLKDTRIRQFALLNGSMIRIIHMRQHRHQATYKCEANNGVDPPISATTQLTVYRGKVANQRLIIANIKLCYEICMIYSLFLCSRFFLFYKTGVKMKDLVIYFFIFCFDIYFLFGVYFC